MHSSNYIYHHGTEELHGFLAYDDSNDKPRPAVIVTHDWTGRNDFACHKAEMMAEMGYLGFALDMYGEGRLGTTDDEKKAMMGPLVGDRALLCDRIQAALDAVIAMPEVDSERVAVIGFCFGGLCALDLARSGANLRGTVSFHGLLNRPDMPIKSITSKILVLHGYDDPMVTPDMVNSFCDEMTQAKADWQMHMYGHVQHGFTNPKAHDKTLGTVYNETAAHRSWIAMTHFLEEVFI